MKIPSPVIKKKILFESIGYTLLFVSAFVVLDVFVDDQSFEHTILLKAVFTGFFLFPFHYFTSKAGYKYSMKQFETSLGLEVLSVKDSLFETSGFKGTGVLKRVGGKISVTSEMLIFQPGNGYFGKKAQPLELPLQEIISIVQHKSLFGKNGLQLHTRGGQVHYLKPLDPAETPHLLAALEKRP